MKQILLFCLISCLFITQAANAQITGPVSICEGESSTYNVATSGLYCNWHVSGGTTLSTTGGSSAQVTWGIPGTYTVSVMCYSGTGDTVTTETLSVTVHPTPDPVIIPSVTTECERIGKEVVTDIKGEGRFCKGDQMYNACDSSVVTYYTSVDPSDTVKWTVYGGTILSGQGTGSLTVYWDTIPGVLGYVQVEVTNAFGCLGTSVVCVYIVPKPIANFSFNDVCIGAPMNFTNLSVGADALLNPPYTWYFGDGGTSFAENPSHTYTSPGTYTVTLIVRNACNCIDSIQYNVTVESTPAPEIECPSVVCPGDTAYYCTNSLGCSTYYWDIDGGYFVGDNDSTCVTVVWGDGTTGPGTISLFVDGCTSGTYCSDTTHVTVPIVPPTMQIAGDTIPCQYTPTNYSLPITSLPGTVFTWYVTGGGYIQNPTFAGMYNLTTVSGFNLTDVNINWNTGIPGDYYVKVEWENEFLGCSGNSVLLVHVRPRFYASGPNSVCVGATANYTANTNTYPTSPVNSNWSFDTGVGTVVSGGNGFPNISIQWNTPGTYTVTAIPTNSPITTCTDSFTVTTTVINPPAMPDSISGPALVCPNSTNTYVAYTPDFGSYFMWLVQGGSPSIYYGNNANITWDNSGNYQIKLVRVTNTLPACYSDTLVFDVDTLSGQTLTISGDPIICQNDTAIYSTVSGVGITDYNWYIDPAYGTIVAGQNTSQITVIWNGTSGSTNVGISLTQCGSSASTSYPVTVNAAPVPVISSDTLCPGGSATLFTTASFSTYSWFDDNNMLINVTPTIAVTDSGWFSVEVTNAAGCIGLARYYMEMAPNPVASISTPDPRNFCIPNPINATLHALVSATAPYTYEWFHNGPSTGVTSNPFAATLPGIYWAQVTNSYGCTLLSNPIALSQDSCDTCKAQTPDFITITVPTLTCNPVAFGTSYTGTGTPLWYFGDGTYGSGLSVTHSYDQAGYYFVEVGADSCAYDSVNVTIPLVADFQALAACAGQSVCFTDLSTHITGTSIIDWTWDFGDGNNLSGTTANPCHTYATGGTYTIQLTVNNGVCSATYDTTIVISGGPNAEFAFDAFECVNGILSFNDLSTPAGSLDTWAWTFGDGGTSSAQNTSHWYSVAGAYPVQLVVTDNRGCKDTVVHTVTISADTAAAGQITVIGTTPTCAGTPVVLQAPAGSNYQWSNGYTGSSLTVYQTGVYWVRYESVDGCEKQTDAVAITIIDINANLSGTDQICEGGFAYLYANPSIWGSTNYSYQWFQNGNPLTVFGYPDWQQPYGSSNPFYLTLSNATPAHSGMYSVVITDNTTGCIDTAYHFVQVDSLPPVPNITLSDPDEIVCIGDVVQFTTDAQNPFFWSNGSVSSTITVTAGPGWNQYNVTAINPTTGCRVTTEGGVWADPLADMDAFMAGCYTKCGPDTLYFPDSQFDYTYSWLFNGSPIGTPDNYLIVTQSGDYQVVVTGLYSGCSDTTGVMSLTLIDCCGLDSEFSADSVCIGEQICFIPAVTYSGITDISHQWYFGDGGFSADSLPCYTYASADIFTVTHIVKGPNCTDTTTQVVVVYPMPHGSIQLLGCNPFCEGDSVYLTVTGMYDQIEWISFDGTVWSTVSWDDTLTVTQGGTYNAVLHNGMCVDSCLSIILTQQPSPEININDTTVCVGDSVTLDAGPGFTSYLWSTGDTSQTITVGAGQYWVQVGEKAAYGCCTCIGIDTVNVFENDLGVQLSDTILCKGDSLQLSPTVTGGIPGYTYLWNTGEVTSTIVISSGGTYWVQVTDALGCTATDSATVTLQSPPTAGFSYQQKICLGDTICFTADSISNWTVYDSTGTLINTTLSTNPFCYIFGAEGTYTIVQEISNSCGTATDTAVVTVVEPVKACIKMIGTNPFCQGDSILLTIDDPYGLISVVHWVNAAGDTVYTGDTLVVTQSGTYYAYTEDENGCGHACICVVIEQAPAPVLNMADTLYLCKGQEFVNVSAGEGYSEYIWYYNGVFLTYGATNIIATAPGSYTVTVTGANGCTATHTTEVVLSSVIANITASATLVCLNDIVTLTATCNPNYTYQWYDEYGTMIPGATGCNFTDAANISPWSTYTVVVIDTTTGCQVTLQRKIKVKVNPCFQARTYMSPNPASDYLTIHHFQLYEAKEIKLDVYDALGRVIRSYSLDPTKDYTTVDVSSLEHGVYFTKVVADGILIDSHKLTMIK